MPSITMRNMPDELYERLKVSAHRNRRSINQEGIIWLERGLNRFEAMDEESAEAELQCAAAYAKRLRNGCIPIGAKAVRMLELGERE